MMSAVLRDSLLTRLRALNQALRVILDDVLAPRGLALRELGVLVALEQHPGLSGAELARASFMTPQAMNETITALERARLVARAPDVNSARILRARLTESGRRELRDAGRDLSRVEATLRSAFDDREQRALASLLDRALAVLRELAVP